MNHSAESEIPVNKRVLMMESKTYSLEEAHRYFAGSLNGEVWDLLSRQDRSRLDEERLLAAAFASYYHWLHAGSVVNMQRGEYMIARAFLKVKNFPEAVEHAKRCYEITEDNAADMQDFDVAYAFEILVRSSAASGFKDNALENSNKARRAGEQIKGKEDNELFFSDFNGGDCYGIHPVCDYDWYRSTRNLNLLLKKMKKKRETL